jgi:hypothetical protein
MLELQRRHAARIVDGQKQERDKESQIVLRKNVPREIGQIRKLSALLWLCILF